MEEISRRAFVQAGLTAGAALAITPHAVGAGAQETAKNVRVGVIGTGNRGTALINTLLQLPYVTIPAVCDVVADKANAARDAIASKSDVKPDAYTHDDHDFQNLVARNDLDAVVIATPWQWHAQMAVAAMNAGKYAGVEVPAAITLDECWELVHTSQRTGMPCMMLENVCYFRNALTVLRMVREGVLGELLHGEAGYQHNCKSLLFDANGNLTWRGQHVAEKNGNLYPTHAIGPVAQWMNINHGDRFTQLCSISSQSKSLRAYAAAKLGPDHPLAKREYALGDVNTTLLKTANGRTVTLYFDIQSHRPYDLILRVQGTKGTYHGSLDKACVDGITPNDQWESFDPYLERFAHPLWTELESEAQKNGGHGGADYITMYEFIKAVRNKTQTPQDVQDAATWSAIFPLSIASVKKDGKWLDFPDFTKGAWKTA